MTHGLLGTIRHDSEDDCARLEKHVHTGTFGARNISEKRLATNWTIRGTNPGGSEIFHAVQTGRKVLQASCKMDTRPFQGVKEAGAWYSPALAF